MDLKFIRTLRTLTSERFLVQSGAEDIAAVEMHYLDGGCVFGTVILLSDAPLGEANVSNLLQVLDENLLPMASLGEKTLSFTVVHGKIIGQFENER